MKRLKLGIWGILIPVSLGLWGCGSSLSMAIDMSDQAEPASAAPDASLPDAGPNPLPKAASGEKAYSDIAPPNPNKEPGPTAGPVPTIDPTLPTTPEATPVPTDPADAGDRGTWTIGERATEVRADYQPPTPTLTPVTMIEAPYQPPTPAPPSYTPAPFFRADRT